jgi:hypothetical protein
MNDEETLALYDQGSYAWNKWAEEMLAQKRKLDAISADTAAMRKWKKDAKASFVENTFTGSVIFDNFIFPDEVHFIECDFKAHAMFLQTKFLGKSGFHKTIFRNLTLFDGAIFEEDAVYTEVDSVGAISFDSTQFKKTPICKEFYISSCNCI